MRASSSRAAITMEQQKRASVLAPNCSGGVKVSSVGNRRTERKYHRSGRCHGQKHHPGCVEEEGCSDHLIPGGS